MNNTLVLKKISVTLAWVQFSLTYTQQIVILHHLRFRLWFITIYIAIDLCSKSTHHCVNVLTKTTNTNYFSFKLLILDCDISFFFPSLASYQILNSVTNTINLTNIAQISTHLYAPLTRKHCPIFNADKSFVGKTTDSPTHLKLPWKG